MRNDPSAYETFPSFLKQALKTYWDSDKAEKAELIAMLLATTHAWEVAWDEVTDRADGKKVLTGAAGVAAVTVLLRSILGGPIGILLTGVSAASLIALYAKHKEQIWSHADHYKSLVEGYEPRYNEIFATFTEGNVTADQRDLMLDGLLARFVAELQTLPEDAEET